MASIQAATVKLELDDTKFKSGIKNASNSMKDFGKTVQNETNNSIKIFEHFKTVIAGLAFGEAIIGVAQLSTEIVNTAKSLQMSTEAAYGFQKAVAAAGGDADNARDALISLNQKIGEATTQGGDALQAFQQLGISLTDLSKSSPEEILKRTVGALGDMKDATQQADIQNRIFGEDIKNTDLKQVSQQLQGYVDKAKNVAPALESARKAQLQFNSAWSGLQEKIAQEVPWDTIASGIKSISDNLSGIVSAVKILGALALGFFAVSKSMEIALAWEAAFTLEAYRAGKGIIDIGSAMSKVGTIFSPFTKLWGVLSSNVIFLWEGLKNGQLIMMAAGRAAAGLMAILGRFAFIYSIATAVNELVKAFTGFDILDWVGTKFMLLMSLALDMVKAFGYLIGVVDDYSAISKHAADTYDQLINGTKATTDAVNTNTDATKKNNDEQSRTSKLLTDTTKAMNDMVQSYRDAGTQRLKAIADETSMIGVIGDQATMKKALIDLDNERLAKVKEFNDKIKEQGLAPEQQAIYKKGIDDVNAAYKEQVGAITDAMNAQIAANQANREALFADEQRIASTQRIRDLENEQAKIFLPLIEQKYRDIEKAATDSITAQIEAETKARGLKSPSELPLEVVNKITESVRQQIEYEKQLAAEVEKTTEAFNLQKYSVDTLWENGQKVKDIYADMAMSTMTPIQKIQAQIAIDSRKAADNAIKEEEARRGSKLSAEEAQKYYTAATQGTKELMDATVASYNQSRQWATGWGQAMNDYIEQATDGAAKAKNIFSKMMSGIEDLLVNFIKTGKLNWKEFLAMMVEELLRAQIQAIFAQMLGGMQNSMSGMFGGGSGGGILGGLFGGGGKGGQDGGGLTSILGGLVKSIGGGLWDSLKSIGGDLWDSLGGIGSSIGDMLGGIGSSIGDLFGGFFANGGTLGAGNWGIAGENGPEIISGPATITPMGGGQPTYVTYNINATDALSFKQQLARDPSFIHALVMQSQKSIPSRR